MDSGSDALSPVHLLDRGREIAVRDVQRVRSRELPVVDVVDIPSEPDPESPLGRGRSRDHDGHVLDLDHALGEARGEPRFYSGQGYCFDS